MFSTGPYKYNRFDLLEKKADKDYDGDGKVESGKDEYFGSKDKAIKKAMGNCPDGKCGKCPKCKEKKEEFNSSVKALIDEGVDFSEYTWDELYEGFINEGLPPALLKAIMKKKGGKVVKVNRMAAMTAGESDAKKSMNSKPAKVTGGKTYTMKGKDGKPLFAKEVKEGFKPLPTAKMARQSNKAYGKEQQAVRAGDEAGANKQMQRRIAMTDPKGRKAVLSKEDISQYLMDKGFANNSVSADVIAEHMSQEWLDQIIESD